MCLPNTKSKCLPSLNQGSFEKLLCPLKLYLMHFNTVGLDLRIYFHTTDLLLSSLASQKLTYSKYLPLIHLDQCDVLSFNKMPGLFDERCLRYIKEPSYSKSTSFWFAHFAPSNCMCSSLPLKIVIDCSISRIVITCNWNACRSISDSCK